MLRARVPPHLGHRGSCRCRAVRVPGGRARGQVPPRGQGVLPGRVRRWLDPRLLGEGVAGVEGHARTEEDQVCLLRSYAGDRVPRLLHPLAPLGQGRGALCHRIFGRDRPRVVLRLDLARRVPRGPQGHGAGRGHVSEPAAGRVSLGGQDRAHVARARRQGAVGGQARGVRVLGAVHPGRPPCCICLRRPHRTGVGLAEGRLSPDPQGRLCAPDVRCQRRRMHDARRWLRRRHAGLGREVLGISCDRAPRARRGDSRSLLLAVWRIRRIRVQRRIPARLRHSHGHTARRASRAVAALLDGAGAGREQGHLPGGRRKGPGDNRQDRGRGRPPPSPRRRADRPSDGSVSAALHHALPQQLERAYLNN
mmetsp:Transcript_47514/g.108338  ORF Transcript_47514/g.108338 Transcript_47514/m.108338 type:complete len:365 (+) Transcript_47514:1141-2235(+)